MGMPITENLIVRAAMIVPSKGMVEAAEILIATGVSVEDAFLAVHAAALLGDYSETDSSPN